VTRTGKSSPVLFEQLAVEALEYFDFICDVIFAVFDDSRQKGVGYSPPADHPSIDGLKAIEDILEGIQVCDVAVVDNPVAGLSQNLFEGVQVGPAIIHLYACSWVNDYFRKRVSVKDRHQLKNFTWFPAAQSDLYGKPVGD
jgi:hypothetical protein